MQRFLSIVGPLPFMALAILVAGLALGVGVFVFDQYFSAPISAVTSWLRYPLTGLAPATSYFAYVGVVVAALQVVAVIVLRAHWTMDVLAGLFAAVGVGVLAWQG
jgi:hypothetical protein